MLKNWKFVFGGTTKKFAVNFSTLLTHSKALPNSNFYFVLSASDLSLEFHLFCDPLNNLSMKIKNVQFCFSLYLRIFILFYCIFIFFRPIHSFCLFSLRKLWKNCEMRGRKNKYCRVIVTFMTASLFSPLCVLVIAIISFLFVWIQTLKNGWHFFRIKIEWQKLKIDLKLTFDDFYFTRLFKHSKIFFYHTVCIRKVLKCVDKCFRW